MSEIGEKFQELIRENGDKVDIHTAVCVEWLLEHNNCSGCPSELGCSKAVCMVGLSMIPMFYKPKDYDDYLKMQKDVEKRMYKILKAKTKKEVQSIRW